MVQPFSSSAVVGLPLAPSGWRLIAAPEALPAGVSEAAIYRSPSGLAVSVSRLEEEGRKLVRVIASREARWPERSELEFVARYFVGEGAGYEVRQVAGVGPLSVYFERPLDEELTEEASHEALERVITLNEAANRRRDQSTMRASMKRAQGQVRAPEGWRRRPSPLGPPVYDRDGVQVIVCEAERDSKRWATVSVGRLDRKPTHDEALAVVDLFLGSAHGEVKVVSDEQSQRKVVVLECELD